PARIASFSLTLACFLAIPLAIGISWLLEKWLKQVWHSGYTLTLQNDKFHVSQPEFDDLNFDLSLNFVNLNWYFKLVGYKRGGRERRVSEKWLCFCCQVQQDECRLIVYTFAPPQKTAVYQTNHPLHFEKLNPVDVYSSNLKNHFSPPTRPSKLPVEIISGKNGRYWLAEQRRWTEGLELTFADFETFINYINARIFEE
ncbi:MAG: hypothetical protein IAF02_18005, partial [Anaerolineae bacterium]|nr:hypothetical protein [Anaerolineae bacterium]